MYKDRLKGELMQAQIIYDMTSIVSYFFMSGNRAGRILLSDPARLLFFTLLGPVGNPALCA